MVNPHENTLAKNNEELRNISLHDPYYGFVASYEIQTLDYTGACIFKTAKQQLIDNDGAFAFIKGSPYTHLFNRRQVNVTI